MKKRIICIVGDDVNATETLIKTMMSLIRSEESEIKSVLIKNTGNIAGWDQIIQIKDKLGIIPKATNSQKRKDNYDHFEYFLSSYQLFFRKNLIENATGKYKGGFEPSFIQDILDLYENGICIANEQNAIKLQDCGKVLYIKINFPLDDFCDQTLPLPKYKKPPYDLIINHKSTAGYAKKEKERNRLAKISLETSAIRLAKYIANLIIDDKFITEDESIIYKNNMQTISLIE